LSRTARDPATSTVTNDECIAHLKLLACFADLRDKVATTDGLFNVYDREIDHFAGIQERNEAAALLREKRWAVYLTRAVDRYTTWLLNCVPTDGMGLNHGVVTMDDLEARGTFDGYPEWTSRIRWTEDMLPPLGQCRAICERSGTPPRTDDINIRCHHGVARTHAQSTSLSGRLHAPGQNEFMGGWFAVGDCERLYGRNDLRLLSW